MIIYEANTIATKQNLLLYNAKDYKDYYLKYLKTSLKNNEISSD